MSCRTGQSTREHLAQIYVLLNKDRSLKEFHACDKEMEALSWSGMEKVYVQEKISGHWKEKVYWIFNWGARYLDKRVVEQVKAPSLIEEAEILI